ncbi:PGF-CTERM sorting domain-containing protein [Methanocorpusculum sp. MG]|uniref:PGF-CTERM sorting domain-containing protein n=1 Tax=Methanocorpusculum petauri TaxID=3002863 RepID=A0ABT4IG72_9EURY|nr:PGF-CTERM sorting domain-containing protein [Methanocorpusculum petauri]MCZ0860741.1 PGF-CTERM sorting domain-containing protein [Methanocorpusculum petauri]
MKNTKIMVVLAIFLAAALFVSAGAAAANAATNNTSITIPDGITLTNGTASIIEVKIGLNATDGGKLTFKNVTIYDDENNNLGNNGTTLIPQSGTYFISIKPVKAGSQLLTAKFVISEDDLNENNATYTSVAVNVQEAAPVAESFGPFFVYEKISPSDIGGAKALYKLSGDATPAVLDTIAVSEETTLLKEMIGNNVGVWYTSPTGGSYATIWYPEITLKAELTTGDLTGVGTSSGDSIDGKTINKDTNVTFKIDAPKLGGEPIQSAESGKNISTVKIVFTTPAGGKTTEFGIYNFANVKLESAQTTMKKTTQPGNDAAAGQWTAQAEFETFGNFSGFKDYGAKSNTITFTIQSSTLTITAAKDSVVRSNPFTVTIQGKSQGLYNVTIENAVDTDVNPSLQPNQNGWQKDLEKIGTSVIGAQFKTDASGKRTIQYNTAAETTDKTYTIRVEKNGDHSDYDKVKVKVEKGAVTISASGDGTYYIGEEITLTGTNTDSTNVFLFVTGPNLKHTDGVVLKDLGGDSGKENPAYSAANPVQVRTDNTWEYKWDTTLISLDDGAYTVYATSRLTNGKSSGEQNLGKVSADSTTWLNSKANVYGSEVGDSYYAVKLSDSEYATVSVSLKKPFLSAVPSGTVVAKGDKIYLRGTAEGDPNSLMLYIFGPNFYNIESITVEDDGTYEKKIEIGNDWASNQYYVVIEHPMENGVIDVYDTGADSNPRTLSIYNANKSLGVQSSFVVEGAGKLQSANAADALTKMIDNPNIDDIYTKLTFTVAEPRIDITNPGDKAVGTKFTISGTTNLAVDDQILVEVVSSSFNAVDKSQSSATSGVSQSTKVVAGEGADNTWSVEVDTTNWKLDEYTIKVQGIEVGITATTNFNLVEKVVTQTPTATTTGAPATTTATATATATPSTPGFGAFIALAGLGAVALLVLRRN